MDKINHIKTSIAKSEAYLSKLHEGEDVYYVSRDTGTYPIGNNKIGRYTQEVVWRGIWDGEKAVLRERFDPRGLTSIVRKGLRV